MFARAASMLMIKLRVMRNRYARLMLCVALRPPLPQTRPVSIGWALAAAAAAAAADTHIKAARNKLRAAQLIR